ncbi:DUF4383 domain-containing protein [Leptolyngbya sp. AN03gr2]|uniref:DUF4383 domain-containing protein n=1 Tax=unclassified Leptolyngbya TaxID=2650499 RepID=UPI003D31D96A
MKRGQLYAFVTGIFFLSLSILGFIPQLQNPINAIEVHNGLEIQLGYLFGLLPINPILNTVYAIVGILGLVSSIGLGGSRFYGRGLFQFFGVLAILGSLTPTNTFFGLMPLFGSNATLYAVMSIVSFYFGFIDAPGLLEIAAQPPENAVGLDNSITE